MAKKTKTLKITVSWETWQKIDALDFCGLNTPKSLIEDAVVVREQLFKEGYNAEYKRQYEIYLNSLNKFIK